MPPTKPTFQKVQITARSLIFLVAIFYGIDIGLKFLRLNQELIFSLLLAFIFMSGLKPFVHALENKNVPRIVAAIIVFVTTVAAIAALIAFVIPTLVTETIAFLRDLPFFLEETFPFYSDYFNSDSLVQFLPNITENFVKVASGVFSNILFIISVMFFTFYFLLEERLLQTFISKFLDKGRARRVVVTIRKIEMRMGAWMRGQLILMTLIGVLTYIGLSLLGVKYALSLAVFAGLLEIIPIIGPIVTAIPSFIVASSSSLWLGGATILLHIIIQQAENHLIIPYVMKKTVGIHPITTLIALSIGGKLGGILGAILAVPVALLIEGVLIEVLKERED